MERPAEVTAVQQTPGWQALVAAKTWCRPLTWNYPIVTGFPGRFALGGEKMGYAADPYDVFFSCHWRDHIPVEAVAQALRQQGLKVFLDRWYLIPGRPWPQTLRLGWVCCF